MGSSLNYTSKPLEWDMFGPLAPTAEGLPVGTREIISPWCSVITGSWLSLLCNAWGMQCVLGEFPTAGSPLLWQGIYHLL